RTFFFLPRPPKRQGYRIWCFFLSSFPRKRESMAAANAVEGWIPAFAGMTEVRNRRLLRHMRSPCPKRGEGRGEGGCLAREIAFGGEGEAQASRKRYMLDSPSRSHPPGDER